MRCTQATLEAFGIIGVAPIHGTGVVENLKAAGFSVEPLFDTTDDYLNPVGLKDYINSHSTGSFYIMSDGHAMALVDGKLTDTSERKISNRIKVVGACRVVKKG